MGRWLLSRIWFQVLIRVFVSGAAMNLLGEPLLSGATFKQELQYEDDWRSPLHPTSILQLWVYGDVTVDIASPVGDFTKHYNVPKPGDRPVPDLQGPETGPRCPWSLTALHKQNL